MALGRQVCQCDGKIRDVLHKMMGLMRRVGQKQKIITPTPVVSSLLRVRGYSINLSVCLRGSPLGT